MSESERVRDRHSRYYGAFLQEQEQRLRGSDQGQAFGEILGDVGNVWAAWEWAVEREDVATIGKCVETLAHAGQVRRWYHETTQAFDHAAAMLRQRLDLAGPSLRRPAREQTALVLADILSRQGLLRNWHGLGEQAVKLCQESLALLEDVEPGVRRDSVTIHAKVVLGGYFANRGDRSHGKQLLREALALAEEAGAPWDREYALFHLGMHASHEGRYPQAEGFLQRAIAIADDIGEQAWRAHSLNRLSWTCWAEGEYQRAEMAVEESLQIFRELEDPVGMGFGFLRLGEIATALGKYEPAAQYFKRSFAVLDEFGDPILHTEILEGQGTLALALGQHAEAKELFRESLTIARKMGHAGLLAGALVGLGRAALALGEAQQARECFCQALEGAMKAESVYRAVSAVMGMANLLAKEGDPQQAAKLLALVLHHPTSLQITKDRAQHLLAELASELPPEVLAEATARGQARELEEVAVEIVERYTDIPKSRQEATEQQGLLRDPTPCALDDRIHTANRTGSRP